MLCVLSFGNWRNHQMTGEQEELFLKHWVLFSWYKMRSLGLGTEKGSLVIPVVSASHVLDNPSFSLDCDINDPCGSLPTPDILFFYGLFATFSVFHGLYFCYTTWIVQGGINWFCLGCFIRSIHGKDFGTECYGIFISWELAEKILWINKDWTVRQ